jgi:phospholipid/cholesterol/gamma-HCH transport system ATP-binding protein
VTAPDAARPAVEFAKVRKAFRGVSVLRGVDLAIRPGETFTILGGSGSGKSVCLKHMIGLLRPDSGKVLIGGRDVTRLSEEGWVAVRRDFGMVFQGAALFDSLTVYENVAYPLREHLDWREERIRERVRTCLEAVGLAGAQPMLPSELSGGMRKRVGVARAIALEPKIILYDEPTTGLDPANSRRISELIRMLQERLEVTSVVVTHEMELCFAVSDRVALLRDGVVAVEGMAEEMRRSGHPEMRAFIEGSFDPAPAALGSSPLEGGADGR